MNVYCLRCNRRLMVDQDDGAYVCMGCEYMVEID